MTDSAKSTKSANYYRILGTNSNASDDLIKQRYQEKVKEFPPEKNPAEFERIEQAYDTLSDPFKKSKYDLKTKYRGKGERLLRDALVVMDYGQFKQAEDFLEEASEILEDNISVLKGRAHLALMQQNLGKFNQLFDKIEEIAPTQKFLVLAEKASVLLCYDYYAESGFEQLIEIEKKFPDEDDEILELYLKIYDKLGEFEKLWSILSNELKNAEEITKNNIRLFKSAINIIIKYKRWDKKESLIEVTEYLVEKIKENRELKVNIFDYLDNYFEYAKSNLDIDTQIFLIDIYSLFQSDQHQKIVEKERIKSVKKIMEELDQISSDNKMSSFIYYKGVRMFFETAYPMLKPEKFVVYPGEDKLKKLEKKHRKNMNSIFRMIKRYPAIYEKFEEKWIKIKKRCEEFINQDQLSLFEK